MVKIHIDLNRSKQNAEAAQAMLEQIRTDYDLAKYEYTKIIRIAPNEIPHSHPVLTLNTRYAFEGDKNADRFLAVYIHEQIHWALSNFRDVETDKAVSVLQNIFPDFHSGFPATANDEHSTYLHFIVNWLEVNILKDIIGFDRALWVAQNDDVYHDIYTAVLESQNEIAQVLEETGVIPLPEPAPVSSNSH